MKNFVRHSTLALSMLMVPSFATATWNSTNWKEVVVISAATQIAMFTAVPAIYNAFHRIVRGHSVAPTPVMQLRAEYNKAIAALQEQLNDMNNASQERIGQAFDQAKLMIQSLHDTLQVTQEENVSLRQELTNMSNHVAHMMKNVATAAQNTIVEGVHAVKDAIHTEVIA